MKIRCPRCGKGESILHPLESYHCECGAVVMMVSSKSLKVFYGGEDKGYKTKDYEVKERSGRMKYEIRCPNCGEKCVIDFHIADGVTCSCGVKLRLWDSCQRLDISIQECHGLFDIRELPEPTQYRCPKCGYRVGELNVLTQCANCEGIVSLSQNKQNIICKPATIIHGASLHRMRKEG